MTADEIRKWDEPFRELPPTAEVARARARIEIAAQLAELNEKLASAIGEIADSHGGGSAIRIMSGFRKRYH